ncbi:MAG TPA: glycoside hydrolase family 15 protein [Symbiobacteriaceae bacterium]|nr:glycoside hydrolase family 15 protein [Symbiobacteriaceae bacterium]
MLGKKEEFRLRDRPAIAAAITGNSRLLASCSHTGELTALYWPHIDHGQHIHTLTLGLKVGDGPVTWLHDPTWAHSQSYEPDSAVLWTRSEHRPSALAVDVADFAPPAQEALVRRVSVQNLSDEPQPVHLLVYAHLRLDESPQYNTALYDEPGEAVYFYRRDLWAGVGAGMAPATWQAGRVGHPSDAWPQACGGALSGRPVDCGDANAALSFDLGLLAPGARQGLALFIALGATRAEVASQLAHLRSRTAEQWQQETTAWWRRWLAAGRTVATGNARLDELYRRSLIALKLMSDERGGGLIAGPETAPDYQRSGGYAYCWGRDAAYMTTALDEAGHHAETANFFLKWAAIAQEPDGTWLHRHYVNGLLAPSWGLLQIDEGASILFGAWRHVELTEDRAFAEQFWPVAQRGADFLLRYRDPATGLPAHSIDLWEKRNGLHTYSTAAVYAGLIAAANLAEFLDQDDAAEPYRDAAFEIREALERHLWSEEKGRFLRTIDLQATGPAEPGRADLAEADLPDIALLGVTFPFDVLGPDDERVQSTVTQLEQALRADGAVYRYTGDQYIGGHPWLVCSLWLAIYYLSAGNPEEARKLIDWAAGQATPVGLLPEQVARETGRPTWVTPLAWSHAMFVLAVHRLAEAAKA